MRGENLPTTETLEAQHVTVIHCDACLDISGVGELYARLREALEAHCPIVLEAAQVERIDTAALQTLVAFFQEARARDLVVQWQQPSIAVQTAARRLNLSTCLALPIV
jgi:anti-anti-sigma regulatory factor